MNDINIFANADPKVIANIAFEFFGPNLGCSSVSKTTDAEVIAYSGATGKVRIDNDNFNNSVIGTVDDIEIYFPLDDSILGGTSPSSDLYIPVIPVYCDLAVTPINITYSNASSVNVVPHYKFIQPFILTVLS